LNRRILSSNVQLGESKIIGHLSQQENEFNKNLTLEEIKFQQQEKEFKQKIHQLTVEANNQANLIINNAKAEAENILNNARLEAQRQAQEIETLKNKILEDSRLEGIKLGQEEGFNQAYSEILDKIKSIDVITNSAFKIKKEIISSSELEILELSKAIAEKILKCRLELKPELMLNIIKAAINELKDKEEIKIIVNPMITRQLYDFSEDLKNCINGLKSIKIIEDKTLHMDSAIIESLDSRIDARLESQIYQITKDLMQEYAESPLIDELPKDIDLKIAEIVQSEIKKDK